jgi:hypothetical protein
MSKLNFQSTYKSEGKNFDIFENHFEEKETLKEIITIDKNEKEYIESLKLNTLTGEAELKCDNEVSEWDQKTNQWKEGILVLTNYRLIFLSKEEEKKEKKSFTSLPLEKMHNIEKIGGKSNATEFKYNIEIYLKNGQFYKYYFNPKANTRKMIHKYLKEENRRFFAFDYKFNLKEGMINGHKLYDEKKEFTRQGKII